MRKTSCNSARPKARLLIENLEERAVPAGTWMSLANPLPMSDEATTMMLLSDGSVMVQGGASHASSAWYKLTPDSRGSYVQGTWSQLASMNTERAAFGSNVLTDGRVFVMGGEFSGPDNASTWINTGEIYDPVADTWTPIADFPQSLYGDDPTEVLDNGEVLGGYLVGPETYLYDPLRNTWMATGSKLRADRSDEETWLKLPDGSILSYDIFASLSFGRFEAQRFIPSKDEWVDASNLDPNSPPSLLSIDNVGEELGPAFLLPSGNAIFFGANGNTAVYSPSTNTWSAGPAEPTVSQDGRPTQLVMADAPGAMMPNGDILLALSPMGTIGSDGRYTFPAPTWIYEFNPATNTYTDVTPSDLDLTSIDSDEGTMLVLPSGQVLLSNSSGQLEVFTPDSAPDPAWQPAISDITDNGNNVFTLAGTQLNGLSEGASFGDDFEMATNYPIVRFTDANGAVSYARTFNWSSAGVATGSTLESVEFSLPAGLAPGAYLVSVVANGIASAPALDVLTGAGDTNLSLHVDANDPGTMDVFNNGSELGPFLVGSLSSIFVFAGNADDTIAIDNTFSGVPLTVNEGSGHDTISLGSDSLDTIQGPVTVSGNIAGSLVFNDQSFTSARSFTITAGTVSWGGPTVQYAGVGSMTINGGSGGNTFNVLATPASTGLTIMGGGRGGNTLMGSNAGNTFRLAGVNAGALAGPAYGNSVFFRGVGNLTAGSGGDRFQFADGASLSGNITGGGSDTLDYSNYTTADVIVDLQTGFATGVDGSVSGITTVYGGMEQPWQPSLYNLLIGNGGDTLVGGFSRYNILVAGSRPSTLVGANLQDLLIGGSTVYDTEAGLASWKEIAAYWLANSLSAAPVMQLTSGNGVPILNASVVTGNGGGNTFVGDGEAALLFTDGLDTVGDFNAHSQQVVIIP